MSSTAPASRYMSSRSNGVTKVLFRSRTTSCVSRSPSCSRSLMRPISASPSSGKRSSSSTSKRATSTAFAEDCAYRSKNSRFCGVSRILAIFGCGLYHVARAARVRTRCYPARGVGEIGDFQVDSAKEPPRFANEAERECAKVLDFYGVPWEYEPHTFVLEETEDGSIAEAFTPDFFLPEQNLYLEITVMKQRLVTRKNRKLRKLRERYPEVRVKLFYKRDIERLAQRYRLDLASYDDVPRH